MKICIIKFFLNSQDHELNSVCYFLLFLSPHCEMLPLLNAVKNS